MFTKIEKVFIALLICLILLLGVVQNYCQTKIIAPPYYSHEEHKDYEDMEEDIRFKAIFVITTEPRTIFWKKESKLKVDVGSFSTDDRSRIDKNVQKGCYIAMYCITHNYLYALYPCR